MRNDMDGKNNPRWNGGISEYPNHSELKRNRIKVLQRSKGNCEICFKNAYAVHHIDEDKSNHSLDNLIAVCKSCHYALHSGENGKKKSSKYIRKYGYTIKEIALITSWPEHWIIEAYSDNNKSNELFDLLRKYENQKQFTNSKIEALNG